MASGTYGKVQVMTTLTYNEVFPSTVKAQAIENENNTATYNLEVMALLNTNYAPKVVVPLHELTVIPAFPAPSHALPILTPIPAGWNPRGKQRGNRLGLIGVRLTLVNAAARVASDAAKAARRARWQAAQRPLSQHPLLPVAL